MPTSFSFPRSANSLVRLRMLHIRDRCFKRFGFLFYHAKIMQIECNQACLFCWDAADFMQKSCKSSAIKLACFAEMQLILCKVSLFFIFRPIILYLWYPSSHSEGTHLRWNRGGSCYIASCSGCSFVYSQIASFLFKYLRRKEGILPI